MLILLTTSYGRVKKTTNNLLCQNVLIVSTGQLSAKMVSINNRLYKKFKFTNTATRTDDISRWCSFFTSELDKIGVCLYACCLPSVLDKIAKNYGQKLRKNENLVALSSFTNLDVRRTS